MRVIEVKHNQNLFDIALQEYGNVAGCFWLVEDNDLNGITDNLNIGQELVVRDEVLNRLVKSHLTTEVIATGVDAEGIGFWEINKDFIVS